MKGFDQCAAASGLLVYIQVTDEPGAIAEHIERTRAGPASSRILPAPVSLREFERQAIVPIVRRNGVTEIPVTLPGIQGLIPGSLDCGTGSSYLTADQEVLRQPDPLEGICIRLRPGVNPDRIEPVGPGRFQRDCAESGLGPNAHKAQMQHPIRARRNILEDPFVGDPHTAGVGSDVEVAEQPSIVYNDVKYACVFSAAIRRTKVGEIKVKLVNAGPQGNAVSEISRPCAPE